MPTWNCEDTITKCLLSLENAIPATASFEIIFVDKGSTDNTINDIKYIMKHRYAHVRYQIIHEPGPIGKARLVGLKASACRTVLWLDSDIILPVNYIYDLFEQYNTLKKNKKLGQKKIYGLQGWMDSRGTLNDRQDLWHKWWHGYERDKFNKQGYNLGNPTANLLCLNDYRLTEKQEQELSELKCHEDNYLGKVVRDRGWEMYALDIPTPHLKFESKRASGKSADYEILWQLVGEMSAGKSKLNALWHFKWVFFRGVHSFKVHHQLNVLLLSISIYVNALKVMLKNREILKQERLRDLKDW